MTDESYFIAALDARPGDSAARLLYAGWLAERGDARAAGYEWMAQAGKWPVQLSDLHYYWFDLEFDGYDPVQAHNISAALLDAITDPTALFEVRYASFPTLAAASDALARAFAGAGQPAEAV